MLQFPELGIYNCVPTTRGPDAKQAAAVTGPSVHTKTNFGTVVNKDCLIRPVLSLTLLPPPLGNQKS
jgi:hypothetical protein